MSTSTTRATDTHAIETSRWRIDPSRSSVEFRSPAFWGLTTAKGRFHSYDGTLDLRHQPAIELTLDADSIDTNNKVRDKHLRSAEFFDVADHPQVRFVSDSAALDGERLKVRGQLYVAGQSMPLDLDARLVPVGDELEVEARTHADHRRLGISSGTLGMIRSPSELSVHGRLVRDSD